MLGNQPKSLEPVEEIYNQKNIFKKIFNLRIKGYNMQNIEIIVAL